MAYEGYLTLDGQEIGNNARFGVYAQTMGILTGLQGCPCENTAAVLDDPEYSTPQLDLAPWYDADEPRSQQFAGVMIQEMTGLDDGTLTRSYQPALSGGGVPGMPRDDVRTIAVTAWIAGASDGGLSYGLEWLTAQLRAAADCDDQGNGGEMCVWAYCPDPFDPEESSATTAAWEEVARMLYDVTLVDGPRVVQRRAVGLSCEGTTAYLAKVEFTLQAGAPGIFRLPLTLAEGLFFAEESTGDDCDITWIVLAEGEECPPDCPPTPTAGDDPSCAVVPPPSLPTRLDPCSCTARITSATITLTIPDGTVPRALEAVPLVVINSGSAIMRRLSVRFYVDTLGQGCEGLDPCAKCDEISLTFVPADAVVTLDGRTRRASVVVPGGVDESNEQYLFGPDGGPIQWPAIECGTALCIEVLVDAEHYSADATVDLYLVPKTDAV